MENEVIFKKEFNSINCLRGLLACLYKAMEKVLKDNYQIRMLEEEQAVKICSLQGEIDEAKENLLRVTAEHQQSLSRVREDMAVRLYESMIEDDNEHPQHKASLPEKVWAREKKTFERKIFDLTKINCKLSSDV